MADRRVSITLTADISAYSRALATAAAETQAFGRGTSGLKGPLGNVERQSSSAGKEIDKLSGRVRLAADAFLILGGALGPLGAGAVGGVVALSAQLGALAGGLGVTILATKGLGDALKAVDAYQLEPTAANLAKMNQELGKAGSSGAAFVQFLDSIEPDLKSLQNAAREGLLPGAREGIEALLDRLPELRSLIGALGDEMGDLFAGGGKALGGKDFDAFFNYLKTDGIDILDTTSKALGNLAETAANLFVAFGGVSTDFSGGLLKFTEGLAEASANLDSSAGFQEFVRYIETEGPHALETIGSIANAFLQIVEATAPLGGPVLTVLGKFADIIAAIADSDLGTPIFALLAGMALFNRSILLTQKLNAATFGGPGVGIVKNYAASLGTVITAQDRATMSAKELAAAEARRDKAQGGLLKGVGKSVGVLAGLTLATSDLTEQSGLSNTANLAMLGTLAGPWGAAVGGGVGLMMDFKDAFGKGTDSVRDFQAALQASQGDLVAQQQLIDGMREAAIAAADDVDSDSFFEGFKNAFDPDVYASDFKKSLGMDTASEQMVSAANDAQKALDNLRDHVPTLLDPLRGVVAGLEDVTGAAEEEATAMRDAVDAMRAHRTEAARALNANLNYKEAIDDANKSLKENGATVNESTNKGRANLRSLYDLAGAWNEQSRAAKNAKGSLDEAKDNFIKTATAMDMPIAQAKRLADRLFEIPPKRKTEIEVETSAANAALTALKARMDQIRDKTVHINVVSGPHAGGQTATDEQVGNDRRAPGRGRTSSAPGRGRTSTPSIGDLAAMGNSAYALRSGGSGGSSGNSGANGWHEVGGAANGAAQALHALQAALSRAEKSIDREKNQRDDLISAQQSFMSAVSGAYAKADPFSGGLSDFDTALSANTNDTQAAQAALAAAAAHGLDGPLYQALAASGNLTLLQQFAGLSASDIDIREQQFASQSSAQAGLGSSAADAAGFTQAIKDQTKELREAQQERRELKHAVKSLEERLPDKVEDGARRGIAERQRRTARQVRTG